MIFRRWALDVFHRHIPIPEGAATSIILWASHDVVTSPPLGFFRTCVVLENILERQLDQPINLVDVSGRSYSEILDVFITIRKQLSSPTRKTPDDRWEGYVLNLGIFVMMAEADGSHDFRKKMLEKNMLQITLEILDDLDSVTDESIVQDAHYLTAYELKRIRWALPAVWAELIKLEAVIRTARNVSKLSELIAGPLIKYIGRHLGEAGQLSFLQISNCAKDYSLDVSCSTLRNHYWGPMPCCSNPPLHGPPNAR